MLAKAAGLDPVRLQEGEAVSGVRDGMQLGQHLHRGVLHLLALLRRSFGDPAGDRVRRDVAGNDALDPVHHEELLAQGAAVGLQPPQVRHRYVGRRGDLLDGPELAVEVVGLEDGGRLRVRRDPRDQLGVDRLPSSFQLASKSRVSLDMPLPVGLPSSLRVGLASAGRTRVSHRVRSACNFCGSRDEVLGFAFVTAGILGGILSGADGIGHVSWGIDRLCRHSKVLR